MEEEEVYEVEKILQKRRKGKKVEYLIKWKNYDGPDDNTWEPAHSLEAIEIIEQFEKELKEKEEEHLKEKKERERETKELKEKKESEHQAKELKEKEERECEAKEQREKEEQEQKEIKQKEKEEKKNELKTEKEESEGTEHTRHTDGTEHNDHTDETMRNGEVQIINKPKDKKKEVKPTKKILPAPVEEDVYNVEALMEKKGSKYLVKWENFPEDQNTWEPKSSIPALILKVRTS